jgi:hypothetical protein
MCGQLIVLSKMIVSTLGIGEVEVSVRSDHAYGCFARSWLSNERPLRANSGRCLT